MAGKTKAYNYKKGRHHNNESPRSPLPKFGFRSSLIIVLTAAMSSLVIPYAMGNLGISSSAVTVVANALMISLAVCYSQYFIETDRGFQSNIVKVYLGLFFTIGVISYFWNYVGLYI